MALGANIKKRREELQMTQQQLAEYCGVTEGAIRHFESGLQVPNVSRLICISRALQISLDKLCDLEKLWEE